MLIKPIYLYKIITFFTINIISPLTLLIIPILGSLIILAYPFWWERTQNPQLSVSADPLLLDPAKQYTLAFASLQSLGGNQKAAAPHQEQETAAEDRGNKRFTVSAINELIVTPHIEKQNSQLKKIAIITSLINFIISLFLWLKFDSNFIGYQFITSISNLDFIQLNLGVDGLSLFFVLLTTFITPIALLSSHNDIEKNLRFYLVSILLLETLQIAVFVVLDLLLFYIFFESVLIPLFFIVGVWGASAAKVRAAFLLFLYTL
jgi:hypothetical protein